jgi:hypothetical protein
MTAELRTTADAGVATGLKIVNAHLAYPKVALIEPVRSRFIHIAAEVDRRPAFLPMSRVKRRLLEHCGAMCSRLEAEPGVLDATVFVAVLAPPGRGEFVEKRKDKVHIARFDVAILIECDAAAVEAIRRSAPYRELEAAVQAAASFTHIIEATNARRMGPVDHTRPGIFLFNYFFADSIEQNIAVWYYSAGWFQVETGLDNSTLLRPVEPTQSEYTVINHCRWDGLRNVLPSLLFKRSFHTYVLANFAANNVAAMPILYRMV